MKGGFLSNAAKKEKPPQSVIKKVPVTQKEDKEKKGIDVISTLPQDILHRILSLLDMKQVVQTSLLSRKWRYTWVYVPTINIDDKFWLDKKGDLRKDEFECFVNSVLLLRDGSDVQKFQLICPEYDTFTNRDRHLMYDSWVVSVVRRNVQHLYLQDMCMQPVLTFNLSTNLKTLELKAITLSDEVEEPWCGPVLENLTIENCYHDFIERLVISSTRLKYFMVHSRMPCMKTGPISCEIKICAPNLKFLGCTGFIYKGYQLENLSSLETAHIDTDLLYCDETKESMNPVLGACLTNILKGISNAKSLTLDLEGVQTFAELQKLFIPVPNSFPNLKYLKLKEWSTSQYINVLAKLFESFSCIETLVMQKIEVPMKEGNTFEEKVHFTLFEGTEEMYGPVDIGDWDKLLGNRAFKKLKSVEIQDIRANVLEFDFIEYLWKTASVLENVRIIPAKRISSSKQSRLSDFCNKKTKSLPKACATATISLVQK